MCLNTPGYVIHLLQVIDISTHSTHKQENVREIAACADLGVSELQEEITKFKDEFIHKTIIETEKKERPYPCNIESAEWEN